MDEEGDRRHTPVALSPSGRRSHIDYESGTASEWWVHATTTDKVNTTKIPRLINLPASEACWLGTESVCWAVRRRCSPRSRCRSRSRSAWRPSRSPVACNTASQPPGSCDVPRRVRLRVPDQSHRSMEQRLPYNSSGGWKIGPCMVIKYCAALKHRDIQRERERERDHRDSGESFFHVYRTTLVASFVAALLLI